MLPAVRDGIHLELAGIAVSTATLACWSVPIAIPEARFEPVGVVGTVIGRLVDGGEITFLHHGKSLCWFHNLAEG